MDKCLVVMGIDRYLRVNMLTKAYSCNGLNIYFLTMYLH